MHRALVARLHARNPGHAQCERDLYPRRQRPPRGHHAADPGAGDRQPRPGTRSDRRARLCGAGDVPCATRPARGARTRRIAARRSRAVGVRRCGLSLLREWQFGAARRHQRAGLQRDARRGPRDWRSSGVGIAGAYSDGTGDFQNGAGRYKPRAWSASGYARGELGPVRLLADGTYGEIDYRQIRRSVQLGPTIRTHDGETDGNYVAGRITGALDLVRTGGLAFGPDLAVQYDRVRLAGYAEAGGLSTAAAFGRQQIESLTGRFGAVVRSLPGEPVRVFVRAGYEREFDDDPRTLTMTPTGAPIRFTSSVERADRNYMSYAMGVDGQVAGALSLRAGVAGYALRDDRDSVTAFAGLSAAF
ncbi:autotransporter outer membrane beta-barrel domain-containing protein [Sphingomonas sp. Ant20]|uniref:autotransporter outer membrane beta-barrel domain-containing protein n=1 Tax=Sphingomonas sp. Ant20 TaxID=104605 RepID=UPI0012FEF15E|nr:autotransporter outer membrane beta-barrel domain-containing protein [Sphingomonas sp. Ant20]